MAMLNDQRVYDTVSLWIHLPPKTSHIRRPASRAAQVHWNSWASAHLPNKLLSAPVGSPRNRYSGGILREIHGKILIEFQKIKEKIA